MRSLFYAAILAVNITAPATATPSVDNVTMHLVEADGVPTLTLYSIDKSGDGGAEKPTLRTFEASFGDAVDDALDAEHYVSNRIVRGNMSLGRNSALWRWWAGYELSGHHVTLLAEAPTRDADDNLAVACFDSGVHSCRFTANAPTPFTVVAFTSGDATVLPPAIFDDGVDATVTLTLPGGGTVTLNAPFVLGTATDEILLSHTVRRDYTFRWSAHNATLFIRERDVIDVYEPWTDFALTMGIVYAVGAVLYCWTIDRTTTTRHRVAALPLLGLMYVYWGTYVRLGIVIYVALRTLLGPLVDAACGGMSIEYLALEAIWTVTMVLHEEEPNVTSAALKSILLVVALRDLRRERCAAAAGYFVILDAALAGLFVYTLVVDDLVPVLDRELYTRYGLEPDAPAIVLTLFLVETGLSLHASGR